jgi:hypothetical protein
MQWVAALAEELGQTFDGDCLEYSSLRLAAASYGNGALGSLSLPGLKVRDGIGECQELGRTFSGGSSPHDLFRRKSVIQGGCDVDRVLCCTNKPASQCRRACSVEPNIIAASWARWQTAYSNRKGNGSFGLVKRFFITVSGSALVHVLVFWCKGSRRHKETSRRHKREATGAQPEFCR